MTTDALSNQRSSRRPAAHRARTVALAAAVTVGLALAAGPAHAKDQRRRESHGSPQWVVGHLLAPIGNLFGYVVVEPLTYLFEGVPLFDLD